MITIELHIVDPHRPAGFRFDRIVVDDHRILQRKNGKFTAGVCANTIVAGDFILHRSDKWQVTSVEMEKVVWPSDESLARAVKEGLSIYAASGAYSSCIRQLIDIAREFDREQPEGESNG